MLMLDCPECGKLMVTQPSVAIGIRLLFCYGKVMRKDASKRLVERDCGYRGTYNETSKEIKAIGLRLKRKDHGQLPEHETSKKT
jgi:hypothetical protein